jgi:hypothetical protein
MFVEKQIEKQEASPEARAYIAKLYAEMLERIERGEEEEVTVTCYVSEAQPERVEDWDSFCL